MRFSPTFKPISAFLALSLGLSLGLSGCGSSGEVEKLQQQVKDLQAENTSLKAQLTILKDSFARNKTEELKKALAGAEAAVDPAQSGAAPGQSASGGAPASAQAPLRFSDLDDVATKDMIWDLDRLGVFASASDKFEPAKPITRGEYAEWLFKAINAIEPRDKQVRLAPEAKQIFKDTPATQAQYKYIQALANAGYTIGYEDGTFKPDKLLSREEMLGIKIGVDVGKDLPPWRSQMDTVWKFSDGKDVAEKFTGYVHQDFYVSGPNGSNIQRAFGKIAAFKPKQPVLRSEAAATLWQIGQFGDRDQTFASAVLKKNGG